MMFGTLTWIGFMVMAFGWALLFAATPLIELLATATGRNVASLAHLANIAECTIVTGIGFAIIGALQTGFAALKNFFDTVLERTARPAAKVDSEEPSVQLPSKERTKPVTQRREPQAKQLKIVERGRLKDRAYVLFGDGSVEVETLLGLRRFASLGEAYEFIG